MSVALSWVSVWYFVKYPALYCTAISSGVCCALWGFIFLFQAFILDEENDKHHFFHLLFGAFCSALTFGCRPTVGMICISYIPMGIQYIAKCRNDMRKVIKSLTFFVVPFLLIAILLMAYNYVRFENPLEFGQTYQLTIVDQSSYMDTFLQQNKPIFLGKMLNYLFAYTNLEADFPYIHMDGAVILFPIILMAFGLFGLRRFEQLKENNLANCCIGLAMAVFLVMAFDIMWAPGVSRRYSMDFTFIFCMMVMLETCMMFQTVDTDRLQRLTSFWMTLLCAYTAGIAFLLFFVSGDSSFADKCPGWFEVAKNFLILH